VFIIGTGLSGAVLHFRLNWDLINALFLSVVVGGSSSTIVLPILAQLSAGEEVKTLLSLESIITDVLCIVVALALLEIISSNALDYASAAQNIASAFTTAIVVGFLFGLFWIGVLRKFRGRSLGYVVTLAVMFILYSFNEAIGGSGAIAVLVFGLVLGNSVELAELFKWKGEFQIDASIKKMQTEIAFFVRTFFFVYLGIIFNTNAFGAQVLALVGLLLLALFTGRALIVRALGEANSLMKKYSVLLMTMAPRGLAAAVLAFIPSTMGVEIPFVVEAAFLIILSTNVLASIGAFYYEHNRDNSKPSSPTPSKGKKKPRIVQ
jgi:cell volume regulation protein A